MGYNEELLVESFLKRAVDLLIAQRTTGRLFLSTTVPPIGPPAILRAFAARERRLKIIRHERNQNVGIALRTAIANARNDYFFRRLSTGPMT
jgi:Glycosyl transferase family 2